MSEERERKSWLEKPLRTSAGFAKHERDRKAEERRNGQVVTPEDRINKFAHPSRMGIFETVINRTQYNPDASKDIADESARSILMNFIDAKIAAANGDKTKLTGFINSIDPRSKFYNPEVAIIADTLNTHFHIVLSCFPKTRR